VCKSERQGKKHSDTLTNKKTQPGGKAVVVVAHEEHRVLPRVLDIAQHLNHFPDLIVNRYYFFASAPSQMNIIIVS